LADGLSRRQLMVRTVALGPGCGEATLDVDTLGRRPIGLATLTRLRAEMRRVDVVIAHGSRTLPACAIALFGLRTPFVYRVIGDPRYWSSGPLRRLRVRLFLSRAAEVVALWPAAVTELISHYGVSADRMHVIPNAAVAERFEQPSDAARALSRRRFAIDPTATVVLYMGALSPEKGVATAFAAVSRLPSTILLVVGDGPSRRDLELIAARDAPDRIRFVGSIPDPMAALAAADVVVLPSLSEGMPGVLIEAGLSGLPVVATDVGGVSEVVRHGHTGFIVGVGDAVSLAGALDAAIASRVELGDNARQWCLDQFDMNPVASAWCEVIQRAARRSG